MDTTLPLDQIRTDAGTQTRAATNEETVAEYADRMLAGDEFPPVVVFHDGAEYVLADGFHRVLAAIRIGWEEIETAVRSGTKLDALEYALGANRTNGLKRSNADKRRCVEIAIETFTSWSDRRVAEVCGVSHPFVASLRSPQLVTVTSCREGADGKMRKMPTPKPSMPTPAQAAALMANVKQPEPAPAYVAPVEPITAIYGHIQSTHVESKPSAPVAYPPAYPVVQCLEELQGTLEIVLADYSLEDLRKVDTQLVVMSKRIARRIVEIKTENLNA